jgi:hypothetical protein
MFKQSYLNAIWSQADTSSIQYLKFKASIYCIIWNRIANIILPDKILRYKIRIFRYVAQPYPVGINILSR